MFGNGYTIELTEDLVKRFYFATMGIIDYVTKILVTAFELAVEKGESRITLVSLEMAFDEAIWQGCSPVQNPFSKKFGWELLDKPNMPFHDALEKQGTRQRKGGGTCR
jgi:hypothetical protein